MSPIWKFTAIFGVLIFCRLSFGILIFWKLPKFGNNFIFLLCKTVSNIFNETSHFFFFITTVVSCGCPTVYGRKNIKCQKWPLEVAHDHSRLLMKHTSVKAKNHWKSNASFQMPQTLSLKGFPDKQPHRSRGRVWGCCGSACPPAEHFHSITNGKWVPAADPDFSNLSSLSFKMVGPPWPFPHVGSTKWKRRENIGADWTLCMKKVP